LSAPCGLRAEGRPRQALRRLQRRDRREQAGAVRARRRRRHPLELRLAGRPEPRCRRDTRSARVDRIAGTGMTEQLEHPRLTLDVAPDDHVRGAEAAPLTLVEYGDYECPYCGAADPIVKEVERILGDELRFVFRNFPLS